jgi:hypothetical protein
MGHYKGRSSPLAPYSGREVHRKTESIEVVKDHYLLQMESGSAIKPVFVKLMGDGTLMGPMTSAVENELDAWIKQR